MNDVEKSIFFLPGEELLMLGWTASSKFCVIQSIKPRVVVTQTIFHVICIESSFN